MSAPPNPYFSKEAPLALAPLQIADEKFMRLCYFGGWEGDNARLIDTGLLRGEKTGKIYPMLKNRLKEFRCPKKDVILFGNEGF